MYWYGLVGISDFFYIVALKVLSSKYNYEIVDVPLDKVAVSHPLRADAKTIERADFLIKNPNSSVESLPSNEAVKLVKKGDIYQVFSGHGRLSASLIAGRKYIRGYVYDLDGENNYCRDEISVFSRNS